MEVPRIARLCEAIFAIATVNQRCANLFHLFPGRGDFAACLVQQGLVAIQNRRGAAHRQCSQIVRAVFQRHAIGFNQSRIEIIIGDIGIVVQEIHHVRNNAFFVAEHANLVGAGLNHIGAGAGRNSHNSVCDRGVIVALERRYNFDFVLRFVKGCNHMVDGIGICAGHGVPELERYFFAFGESGHTKAHRNRQCENQRYELFHLFFLL